MLGGLQYSDETAGLLARQLLDGATHETRIAVVSAPSVFVALKNILVSPRRSCLSYLVASCVNTRSRVWASSPPGTPRPALTLLEHDHRFGVFSEFLFYDFMQPVKLPGKPRHVTSWPGPWPQLVLLAPLNTNQNFRKRAIGFMADHGNMQQPTLKAA